MTENGTRTYQVYRWYDGQDGTPKDQGVWRAYNYVHIANTYLNLYKIAKRYPHITTRLTATEYLLMGYRTLEAMFTKIPQPTPIGDAAHDLGLMGELLHPDMLARLREEGRSAEAQRLDGFLQGKRDKIFAQEYPFASEMSIDTTGFEACYTLAKMYGNTALAAKVTRASLAARGNQPLWYFYGSDNRHMGESWWNLGYECQLGAWQQQDYLYSYATTSGGEFDEMMRSTYGAYLAYWANINAGQISADAANIGAASWQFQSEKGTCNYNWIPLLDGWWAWSGEADLGFWGALRAATVNVVEDRIVGLYAYGGEVTEQNGAYVITPKDGVRQRLALYNKGKFGLQIDKARFTRAQVSADLRDIRVTLQSVVTGSYSPDITLRNLPHGDLPGVRQRRCVPQRGQQRRRGCRQGRPDPHRQRTRRAGSGDVIRRTSPRPVPFHGGDGVPDGPRLRASALSKPPRSAAVGHPSRTIQDSLNSRICVLSESADSRCRYRSPGAVRSCARRPHPLPDPAHPARSPDLPGRPR